jgi:hypothetical protein
LNNCRSQIQQPGWSKTVDNKSKEEAYITWNVRGIIDKEEELDEILQQRHAKIAVISENKKNFTRN